MVMDMTLNNIVNKLLKKNIKQYALLFFCIVLTTSFITAVGIILFGETVAENIVAGGNSIKLAKGCYVGLFVGSLVFIGFVFGLFLKYKSREIGIFVSLGLSKKSVSSLVKREINILVPIAILIGLLIAYPIALVVWNGFILFLKIQSESLEIGVLGFLVGIVYAVLMGVVIHYLIFRYIKNFDVIKVMKAEETIEEVKEIKPWVSILGAALIPAGILLFDAFSGMDGIISKLNIPAGFLSFVGLYLVVLRIPFRGKVSKKKSPKKYYNNIIYYNLLQLKGKEYVNTIFLTTLIIGFSTFAFLFINTQMISVDKILELKDVDYSFSYMKDELDYKEDNLDKLAEKHDIEITEYHEFEAIILLTDKFDYNEETKEEFIVNAASDVRFMSESAYNKLTGESLDIKQGEFSYAHSGESHAFIGDEILFTNSKTKKEFTLKKKDVLETSQLGLIESRYFVVDDAFYNEQAKVLTDNEKVGNIIFNTENWRAEEVFAKELKDTIINNTDLKEAPADICSHVADEFRGVECFREAKHMDLNTENASLNKWWKNRPMFKSVMKNESIYDYAVYVLLFTFIATLGFLSAGIILYVKSVSSIWKDKRVYQNMYYLGAKKEDMAKIIKKLQRILFIVPTIVGTLAGLGLLFVIGAGSGVQFAIILLQFGSLIVILVWILQVIYYNISTKKIIKELLDFETL